MLSIFCNAIDKFLSKVSNNTFVQSWGSIYECLLRLEFSDFGLELTDSSFSHLYSSFSVEKISNQLINKFSREKSLKLGF